MMGDFDDDLYQETKDYRQGTIIIYHSPKRNPKIKPPKYGYKFVQPKTKKRKK